MSSAHPETLKIPVSIRFMEEDDIPGVIVLGTMLHATTWFNKFPLVQSRLEEVLRSIIPHDLSFVATTPDHEIVGVFAGVRFKMFFTDCTQSSDLFLYVHPNHRKGDIAPRLLETYVSVAKSLNIDNITVGQSTDCRIKVTERFMRRQGFETVGSSFRYTKKEIG